MALVRATAMFRPFPAEHTYKQRVKLRPNEHHYENDGEEPCIKYTCRLCEQLAENINGLLDYKDEKFVKFSIPKGTEQCPCCGINIDWDYREQDGRVAII